MMENTQPVVEKWVYSFNNLAEDRLNKLEMAILMIYLASGAKSSKSPPITSYKVPFWPYYTSDFL